MNRNGIAASICTADPGRIVVRRALSVLLLLAAALVSVPTAHAAADSELDLLVGWMTGSFSSAEQAAADSSYFDIRLEMVPIWTDRTDGRWLYVEQAAASDPERPYRQRIYCVTQGSQGWFRSEVYTLPDPDRFSGAWRDPAVFAVLAPDSLEVRDGCAVLLRRTGDDSFAGGTLGSGCGSDLRGAVYATSEVTLQPDRMVSWDRGFDGQGRQVWGATGGGYVFQRRSGR